MGKSIQNRDSLAIAVLGVCIVLGTCKNLLRSDVVSDFHDISMTVDSFERTAVSLRASIGRQAREIGYISDENVEGVTPDAIGESLFYFGLQYQLVPVLLVRSTAPDAVVCHLHKRANLQHLLVRDRLGLQSDIGNGFLLLKHEAH